jgi:hypothetical protein
MCGRLIGSDQVKCLFTESGEADVPYELHISLIFLKLV